MVEIEITIYTHLFLLKLVAHLGAILYNNFSKLTSLVAYLVHISFIYQKWRKLISCLSAIFAVYYFYVFKFLNNSDIWHSQN